ncbi:DUF2267 domain-containing protein [Pseudomonas asuensis]
MSSTVEVLDRTIQQTNLWLDDVATYLDAPDRQTAYHALRAVLTSVRDRIGIDNAAHLAAQLPLMIRGIFTRTSIRRARLPKRKRWTPF